MYKISYVLEYTKNSTKDDLEKYRRSKVKGQTNLTNAPIITRILEFAANPRGGPTRVKF